MSSTVGKLLALRVILPRFQFVSKTHRHLSNIECIMALTAYLVCFISTVYGCSKKKKKLSLGRLALVAGT